jgi:hypothetical protein
MDKMPLLLAVLKTFRRKNGQVWVAFLAAILDWPSETAGRVALEILPQGGPGLALRGLGRDGERPRLVSGGFWARIRSPGGKRGIGGKWRRP